jgi:manganese/zinc/iron transport system permease protein
MGLVLFLKQQSRLKDDAAMGIVLSVFFGFGVALLGMIQDLPSASAAGLESFIYGKTASMVFQDFLLLSAVGLAVLLLSILLFKEFALLCFDESFAASAGWPVLLIDLLLLGLVAAVTVVGLQAVGLILIIAFLITPAAAARFWSENLKVMVVLAAGIGAVSGWLGASISALLPKMPAGAVIVLVAAGLFLFSMVFGSARGILKRAILHRRLQRKVGRQHLLRSIFEILENQQPDRPALPNNAKVPFDQLARHRSWSGGRLNQLIRAAKREDHIDFFDGETILLSESGFGEAARTTRNHRLWEMYLIEHADIAPNHVDRDADAVEHVLSADLVRKLEQRLSEEEAATPLPISPHPLIEKGPHS